MIPKDIQDSVAKLIRLMFVKDRERIAALENRVQRLEERAGIGDGVTEAQVTRTGPVRYWRAQ